MRETIDDGDDVAVAAITVAELRVGVQLAKGRRREKRERFVAAVLEVVSIEPYDLVVAEAHAALLAHVKRAGTPRGVDAPFGWPEPMVAAVHAYAGEGRWPTPDKQSFRLRRTDLHVHDRVLAETGEKLWPLSPSTDRISLTAWRLAGLREAAFARSHLRFDRTGGDQVVEAYPAAALLLWGLPREGYKSDAEARERLLDSIEAEAPWLAWEPGAREACVESDDALDAVLCALIARAAALGLAEPPPAEALELARTEGWIHLPRRDSLGELALDRRPS
jgi:predicted nucleic acid-binding protein